MSTASDPRKATVTSPIMSLVPDANPKPRITLEKLPQEIKDQIYEYVIGGSYCVESTGRRYRRYGRGYEPLKPALFWVSKRVCYEAMEVFYSKNEFCWTLNFGQKWPFNQGPTNRMTNILLEVRMREHNKVPWVWDMYSHDIYVTHDGLNDSRCAKILRKKIRIWFQGCSHHTHRSIPTAWFQTLTALTGFQTVIIEITMDHFLYFLMRVPVHIQNTRRLADRENLRTAMRDKLEPTLGPAKNGFLECDETRKHLWEPDGFLSLEFHPRQYLTKSQGTNIAGVRAAMAHQLTAPRQMEQVVSSG